MLHQTGTVTKVHFESDDIQIFAVKSLGKKTRVRLEDKHLRVAVGDHVVVEGSVNVHDTYGEQLHANNITYIPVTNELLADFMTSGTGVGPVISKRLLRAFPVTLIELLEKRDIDTLCTVERVSQGLALVICRNWHKQNGKAQLIEFMDGVLKNTPPSSRRRIKNAAKSAFDFYHEETVKKLNDDPFRLWAFSSFKEADILRKAMNIKLDDERRLVCAVEEAVYRKLEEGSTQVHPLEFKSKLDKIIGEELSIKALIAANNAANTLPPRIIVRDTGVRRNALCKWSEDMQRESAHQHLYTQAYSLPGPELMERYVSEQLVKRIQDTVSPISVPDTYISTYKLPSDHHLSLDQQRGVKTILANSVSLISGGAGTGKTSVLYCVNDLIKQNGHGVLQVALAGKAAQRLIQQTNDAAYTITSLLQKIVDEPSFLDRYECPVLHIDEASMVDLQTMYRVLVAFEGKSVRLVFIGDWAQLAPIGPGLIFHVLMKSKQVAKVELKQNFRSKSGIVHASEKIKAGEIIESNGEVECIEYGEDEDVFDIIKAKYLEHSRNNNEVHVVAARKKTTAESNVMLHKLLMQRAKVIKATPQFRVGDSVIYKKNSISLGLVNGSTGKIVAGETVANNGDVADMVVDFNIEGVKALMLEDVQDEYRGDYTLQHAYAITCHSAQGSEFDTVIVVVENSKLVERSWLYTAITRAKKKVIVISKVGAMKTALKRGFRFEQISVGFNI
ncbi:ATP-dependent RecD-like DNA helicase [Pseudoalteromonas sp. C2R02]|uniref:AAA family ATPase n=1 Tax=Pseudoalteromonas sp. C2R02 TaxID=2841565 RepID=UPI001C0875E7|nr:ATP-dependent RecD-like DNA helicase [Pseudoalteromonas sp. C2R02]MBU2969232.1 ATP-dependent RecD-like DNA helicase [Pseudoalteromonas sp. C2R02]